MTCRPRRQHGSLSKATICDDSRSRNPNFHTGCAGSTSEHRHAVYQPSGLSHSFPSRSGMAGRDHKHTFIPRRGESGTRSRHCCFGAGRAACPRSWLDTFKGISPRALGIPSQRHLRGRIPAWALFHVTIAVWSSRLDPLAASNHLCSLQSRRCGTLCVVIR